MEETEAAKCWEEREKNIHLVRNSCVKTLPHSRKLSRLPAESDLMLKCGMRLTASLSQSLGCPRRIPRIIKSNTQVEQKQTRNGTELEDAVLSRQEMERINKRKSPSSAAEGMSHKEPSGDLAKLSAFALEALVASVIYQRQILRLINTRSKPSLTSMEGRFGGISVMVQSPQVPGSDSFLHLEHWDWLKVTCASLAVATAV